MSKELKSYQATNYKTEWNGRENGNWLKPEKRKKVYYKIK